MCGGLAGGDGDALGRRLTGGCVRIMGRMERGSGSTKVVEVARRERRWCWRGNQGSTANLSGGRSGGGLEQ